MVKLTRFDYKPLVLYQNTPLVSTSPLDLFPLLLRGQPGGVPGHGGDLEERIECVVAGVRSQEQQIADAADKPDHGIVAAVQKSHGQAVGNVVPAVEAGIIASAGRQFDYGAGNVGQAAQKPLSESMVGVGDHGVEIAVRGRKRQSGYKSRKDCQVCEFFHNKISIMLGSYIIKKRRRLSI